MTSVSPALASSASNSALVVSSLTVYVLDVVADEEPPAAAISDDAAPAMAIAADVELPAIAVPDSLADAVIFAISTEALPAMEAEAANDELPAFLTLPGAPLSS